MIKKNKWIVSNEKGFGLFFAMAVMAMLFGLVMTLQYGISNNVTGISNRHKSLENARIFESYAMAVRHSYDIAKESQVAAQAANAAGAWTCSQGVATGTTSTKAQVPFASGATNFPLFVCAGGGYGTPQSSSPTITFNFRGSNYVVPINEQTMSVVN